MMKMDKGRSLMAGIAVLAVLLSCLLSGAVLPASAETAPKATSMTLEHDTLWMLSGRTRVLGITLTNSSDPTAECDAGSLTWASADTAVATVAGDGTITALTAGETSITATLTDAVDTAGNTVTLTASCTLKVVDGTLYESPEVTYTAGDNLVANGDFENEDHDLYWHTYADTPSAYVKAGVGRDGSYGFELTTTSADQYYKAALALQPATQYILTYDYLASPNTTFYLEGLTFGTGRVTQTVGSDGDGEWHTATKVFTTPASLKLNKNWDMSIQCTTANTTTPAVVDNIAIREYSSTVAAESIALTHTTLTLMAGQTHIIGAQATPFEGDLNGTVWVSGNTAVATVKGGYVTAVAEGTTVITATTRNGKTAACTVTVTAPTEADIDLTAEALTWSGDDGDGQVDPGTAVTFAVTVTNNGTDAVEAGQAFVIDVAADGEVVRTITYSGGIAAGQTVTVTDTVPWQVTAGDHMLSARVNAALSVYETNTTTNNTCQINLRAATDRVAPAYNADAVTQAGMDRLTFSDDFDSTATIDTLASGREGYKWYVTRPWAATTQTPNDYAVQNGVLTMMSEIPTYSLGLSTVDVKTQAGFTFNKGYLEVKLRIVRPSPNADDERGVPAVWSLPEGKLYEISGENDHWVEIDWLEYWGITKQRPAGYYTITLHDQTNSTDTWYSNSNHAQQGLGDAEWHVMGWLWENGSLRCFLDGVEVMNQFWNESTAAVPAQSPKTNATATDTGVFSFMNEELAALFLGGSKDNPMEVDYVRLWQASEPAAVSDAMTMEQSAVTLYEHERARLTVSVPAGEDAGTLTWTSSAPTVATVHGNGEVFAQGVGTAVITATNANGQAVQCTVTVQHNRIVGGGFEWDNDLLYGHWRNMTAHSSYAIVAEPDNTDNHCLQVAKSAPAKFYYDLRVEKGKTYRLTGRVSSAAGVRDSLGIYLQSPYVASSNTGTNYVYTADDGGWADFTLEFTTSSSNLNDNYVFAFRHDSGSPKGAVYVDDLMLVEVE